MMNRRKDRDRNKDNMTQFNVYKHYLAFCILSSLAPQIRVFKELGLPMLDNAWKGYNCSIFAYGQTGSGKSYSIMGHGSNKGKPSLNHTLLILYGDQSRMALIDVLLIQFDYIYMVNLTAPLLLFPSL